MSYKNITLNNCTYCIIPNSKLLITLIITGNLLGNNVVLGYMKYILGYYRLY